MRPLKKTEFLKGVPPYPLLRSGKVRENYDLGDHLLVVATDRLSAFDWVVEEDPIPHKGAVLTQMSAFWFGLIAERLPWLNTHFVTADWDAMVEQYPNLHPYANQWRGRAMLVVKADRMLAEEAIVRAYLEGSGFKDYNATAGKVCGIQLPSGLVRCSKLPWNIFTPSTKAEVGHDENITVEQAIERGLLDPMEAAAVAGASLAVFSEGANHALPRKIIVADTKFEFGVKDKRLMLADEVLTPDSSRFWPSEDYQQGRAQASLDKQPVRDWLEKSGWDKKSPPPRLPTEVVTETSVKYLQALEMLTGKSLAA